MMKTLAEAATLCVLPTAEVSRVRKVVLLLEHTRPPDSEESLIADDRTI
jgi:hypothetical protein